MIKRITLGSLSLLLPMIATCQIIVEPGTAEINGYPYVVLRNLYTGGWRYNPQLETCLLTVYQNSATHNRFHVYQLNGSTGGPWGDAKCFGVLHTLFDSDPGLADLRLTEALEGIHVPYKKTVYNAIYPDDGTCFFRLDLNLGRTFGAKLKSSIYSIPCLGTPAPVSCNISTPPIIQHSPSHTGRVRSRKEVDLTVTCTRNASITVSVPEVINLQGGQSKVESRLYVTAEGKSSTTIVADPEASVRLISVIDATEPSAGEYSGSGIIVANWD
jgi:hypothetical protein